MGDVQEDKSNNHLCCGDHRCFLSKCFMNAKMDESEKHQNNWIFFKAKKITGVSLVFGSYHFTVIGLKKTQNDK